MTKYIVSAHSIVVEAQDEAQAMDIYLEMFDAGMIEVEQEE